MVLYCAFILACLTRSGLAQETANLTDVSGILQIISLLSGIIGALGFLLFLSVASLAVTLFAARRGVFA